MLTCRLWVTWTQVLSYLLSRLHGLHLLITAEVKGPMQHRPIHIALSRRKGTSFM
jgi:hypothetical protein